MSRVGSLEDDVRSSPRSLLVTESRRLGSIGRCASSSSLRSVGPRVRFAGETPWESRDADVSGGSSGPRGFEGGLGSGASARGGLAGEEGGGAGVPLLSDPAPHPLSPFAEPLVEELVLDEGGEGALLSRFDARARRQWAASAEQCFSPRQVLHYASVLAVLGVFCLAGARLYNMGFFSPTNDGFPRIVDGAALEPATGAAFLLRAAPPVCDGAPPFDLFGVSAWVVRNATAGAVGLYVLNEGEQELASWRKLASQRDYARLFEQLVQADEPGEQGHAVALRITLTQAEPEPRLLAKAWAAELRPLLRPRVGLVEAERELAAFEAWFPHDAPLPKGLDLWATWDGDETRLLIAAPGGAPAAPPAAPAALGPPELGRAIVKNELDARGPSLVRLLFRHPAFASGLRSEPSPDAAAQRREGGRPEQRAALRSVCARLGLRGTPVSSQLRL
jgi:hypothetical protein